MQVYVGGFMFDRAGHVALVRKLKPAQLAGLFNAIGGKLEGDETPHECMIREWCEETGHVHEGWDHFCSIRQPHALVHFFRAHVCELPRLPFCNDIGEALYQFDARWAIYLHELHPDLKWLIPLAQDASGVRVEAGTGLLTH